MTFDFSRLPRHPKWELEEFKEYRLFPLDAIDYPAEVNLCHTCPHHNEAGEHVKSGCDITPCPTGVYMTQTDFFAALLEGHIDHEQLPHAAHRLIRRFGTGVVTDDRSDTNAP